MLQTAYTWGIALIMALMLAGCENSGVDVSADGSQVVVNQSGALWVADVEKENWRKVPLDGASAASPTWSPDGRYVLFELQPKPKESVSADPTTVSPATEQEKPEPAYAALLDTETDTITRLAPDVGPPFAWRADESGFVALQSDADSSKIAWYGLDGATLRAVSLPKADTSVSRLMWLPGSNEIAFVAQHSEQDTLRTDIFRTEADHIQQLTREGDVVGLGGDSEHGRLLLARGESNVHGLRMALYSYDPASNAMTRLRFPEALSFVHPDPGYTASLESVVFSPNAQRMALVVQSVKKAKREDEPDQTRTACYSVETNASGARLIQQTEPNGGNLYPSWSHDGRRLVILDSSGKVPRLFVYNYDGTGKRMAPLPTEQAETPPAH